MGEQGFGVVLKTEKSIRFAKAEPLDFLFGLFPQIAVSEVDEGEQPNREETFRFVDKRTTESGLLSGLRHLLCEVYRGNEV